MRLNPRSLLLAPLVAATLMGGCADVSEGESEKKEPATVAEVAGSDAKEITLTPEAAKRIDLRTAPIVDRSGTTVMPYAALVYDPGGNTWVFTSPRPLTFVRTQVWVESIAGRDAHLSRGPPAGTEIVTVGQAELYGVENGVGH